MKKSLLALMGLAIFFLFFIQMAGTLIQSIYVLDLMHTSLDAKVLGVFFFFTPLLLIPFRKKLPLWGAWLLLVVFIVCRGLTPSLGTSLRLITAGISTGSALMLMPWLFTAHLNGQQEHFDSLHFSASMALAVGLSVLLRTINFSVDYSLSQAGAWSGWLLGLVLVVSWRFFTGRKAVGEKSKKKGVTSPVFGLFLVITMVYFIFSAPAVVARWTAGSYTWIVAIVSLVSLGWVFLALWRPGFLDRFSSKWLLPWNILFTLSLTGTILAQRVAFPRSPDAGAVIVGPPGWFQWIPLVFMLLLFPVIFADLRLFFQRISAFDPSPVELLPGILLGCLALVILIFATVFTNVWGYIAPVSTPFRNMFWLPFFVIGGSLAWLAWRLKGKSSEEKVLYLKGAPAYFFSMLALIFGITLLALFITQRIGPAETGKTSLVVMTFNIQAGNDAAAERSFDRQLAVIRRVNPDIVTLQESDTARLAMNNDDYVRYFAGKLGYYSYYGPTTVTGTFGTAILSRYPLENTRVVFTYSDTDEIGMTEAEVSIGGKMLNIHDVHPDGSMAVKTIFIRTLVERLNSEQDFVAMGDFNLHADQEPYRLIASKYPEAWTSLHPADAGGWIDHIFISSTLQVSDPTYLLSPDSASDHPAYWATIKWLK